MRSEKSLPPVSDRFLIFAMSSLWIVCGFAIVLALSQSLFVLVIAVNTSDFVSMHPFFTMATLCRLSLSALVLFTDFIQPSSSTIFPSERIRSSASATKSMILHVSTTLFLYVFLLELVFRLEWKSAQMHTALWIAAGVLAAALIVINATAYFTAKNQIYKASLQLPNSTETGLQSRALRKIEKLSETERLELLQLFGEEAPRQFTDVATILRIIVLGIISSVTIQVLMEIVGRL